MDSKLKETLEVLQDREKSVSVEIYNPSDNKMYIIEGSYIGKIRDGGFTIFYSQYGSVQTYYVKANELATISDMCFDYYKGEDEHVYYANEKLHAKTNESVRLLDKSNSSDMKL